ncbi:MAG: beta-lactamase family protein [Deltaproteobacteria bacterium]|nr:beta-lactamase family protein [Deltaproteobacteria bacterium]
MYERLGPGIAAASLAVAACSAPPPMTPAVPEPPPKVAPMPTVDLPPQHFATAPPDAVPSTVVRPTKEQVLAAAPDLDGLLKQAPGKLGVVGLSAAVVLGRERIWTRGYGTRDRDGGDPIDVDTVFRIGSLTKLFTGLAILKLRDAGKLGLDDPVAMHLPEIAQVRYPTTDSPRITIRHLVTHTSGLPRLGKLDYFSPKGGVTEAELLEGLKDLPLEAPPGQAEAYSNLGMSLAGLVVSRVSQQPYRDYVTDQLLEPLGMSSSVWDQDAVPTDRLATGYRSEDDTYRAGHHWRMGASEACGGMYSSTADMARFVGSQLDAWPARNDPPSGPVRRSSIRESHLLAGPGPAGARTFGINWGSISHPKLGFAATHAGGTLQYGATVWLLPDLGLGLVLLANGGGEAGEVAEQLSGVGGRMLDIILKQLPVQELTLSPALETAATQVRALLTAPETEAIEQLYNEAFLKQFPPKRIAKLLTESAATLGACTGHTPLQQTDAKTAVVRLECERGTAEVILVLESPTATQLAGFAIRAIEPRE